MKRTFCLAVAVVLAACGGGDHDEDRAFAAQAELICIKHHGVRSWSTAEVRDRDGNSVTILDFVICRDGSARAA